MSIYWFRLMYLEATARLLLSTRVDGDLPVLLYFYHRLQKFFVSEASFTRNNER